MISHSQMSGDGEDAGDSSSQHQASQQMGRGPAQGLGHRWRKLVRLSVGIETVCRTSSTSRARRSRESKECEPCSFRQEIDYFLRHRRQTVRFRPLPRFLMCTGAGFESFGPGRCKPLVRPSRLFGAGGPICRRRRRFVRRSVQPSPTWPRLDRSPCSTPHGAGRRKLIRPFMGARDRA